MNLFWIHYCKIWHEYSNLKAPLLTRYTIYGRSVLIFKRSLSHFYLNSYLFTTVMTFLIVFEIYLNSYKSSRFCIFISSRIGKWKVLFVNFIQKIYWQNKSLSIQLTNDFFWLFLMRIDWVSYFFISSCT